MSYSKLTRWEDAQWDGSMEEDSEGAYIKVKDLESLLSKLCLENSDDDEGYDEALITIKEALDG